MLNSIFYTNSKFYRYIRSNRGDTAIFYIYHIPAALPAVAVGNARTGPGDPFCSTAEAIIIHWVVVVVELLLMF